MKKCPKCKNAQSLSYHSYCRDCKRSADREQNEKRRESGYFARYESEHREHLADIRKTWNAANHSEHLEKRKKADKRYEQKRKSNRVASMMILRLRKLNSPKTGFRGFLTMVFRFISK